MKSNCHRRPEDAVADTFGPKWQEAQLARGSLLRSRGLGEVEAQEAPPPGMSPRYFVQHITLPSSFFVSLISAPRRPFTRFTLAPLVGAQRWRRASRPRWSTAACRRSKNRVGEHVCGCLGALCAPPVRACRARPVLGLSSVRSMRRGVGGWGDGSGCVAPQAELDGLQQALETLSSTNT